MMKHFIENWEVFKAGQGSDLKSIFSQMGPAALWLAPNHGAVGVIGEWGDAEGKSTLSACGSLVF